MGRKIRILRATLLALACSASLSVLAQTETPKTVDVPAGDLAVAVETLRKQTGGEILYRADQLKGLRTKGVKGTLSTEDALDRLLQGTGYRLHRDESGAVVIVKAAQPQKPPAPAKPQTRTDATSASREETTTLPAIMVQGTRTLNMDITRSRDDPQPYVIFEREVIQQSGAQNLEGFLRDRLSMNSNGLPHGQRVTQLGSQSTFNLRGLGAGQTLILIDGRRLAPGPAAGGSPFQSDINGIPMSAVERIEVLPTTASGIYGGSATGGVINIILRRDYAGTEVKATYGNTFKSGATDRRIDLSTGFNLEGGKTNVLLIASYSDLDAPTLQDRASLVDRYYDIVRANVPGLLLPPNNPPLGSTPNIRSADGSDLVLRDGTPLNSPITHIPAGYAGTATDGGSALVANAGNYNLGLADGQQHITGGSTQIAQAPRNMSLRATVRREFTPRVQAFLEASANETRTSGPVPYTTGAFFGPYRVSASAPNNPFNSDILVTVPTDSLTGSLETTVTQSRATGGLIVALPAKWKAEADYTWARTRVRQGGSQGFSTGADVAAVSSGTLDVLRDTSAFPIDLLSHLTVSPFDALQDVTFQDVALRFAGPILDLPGGPLSLSTLLEYRSEKFADATSVTPGITFFFPGRSASATSLYMETKLPLVSEKNRRPGVEALEVQLAARADEYRTEGKTGFLIVGSDTPVVSARNQTRSVNPTVAIRYQPLKDLVIRTSYGTGFVPPTVGQLAPSISASPLTVIDPQRGNMPTTLEVGRVLQGGNPDLDPEESKSWSMGFVLTPRFAPGLRLSLDYTRIRKTDNIAFYPTGAQGLVDDEALFPERVQRGENLPDDPPGWAGPITLLDVSLLNIASAEVEAFDLQLDYAWTTDLGTLSFSTVATRQMHLRTTTLAGQPTLENVGMTYNNPQRFTGNAELKWQHQGWTAGWLARHYDAYLTTNPSVPGNAATIALQGNGGRIPSQTYHDLFVSWIPELSGHAVSRVLAGTELQLGIRNVFDKTPPFDANVYNIFRTFHSPLGDPLGRSYQVAITKRF